MILKGIFFKGIIQKVFEIQIMNMQEEKLSQVNLPT